MGGVNDDEAGGAPAANSALGGKIRMARRRLKLSQGRLGRMLEVSTATISDWERGNFMPSAKRLQALARILEMSLDELIRGQPDASGAQFRLASVGKLVPKLQSEAVPSADDRVSGPRAQSRHDCSDQAFMITITDPSNAPMFEVGDTAVIDPMIEPIPGDMVLLSIGGRMLFRRYKPDGSRLRLDPLNDHWTSESVLRSKARIHGVMSEQSKPRRVR
jgi:transcriptional regulator with XRE-family HTH domain